MSKLVGVVCRRKESSTSLFRAVQVPGSARGHDRDAAHEGFGDESVEVMIVDGGIDPRIHAG
jgi:hypothetical protein